MQLKYLLNLSLQHINFKIKKGDTSKGFPLFLFKILKFTLLISKNNIYRKSNSLLALVLRASRTCRDP